MPDAPVSPDQPLRRSALFDDLGLSGLQRYSGYIYEEPLPELQLARGRRVYREMAENDATIGGILLAIELLVRQVTWSVAPASGKAAHQQDAQFVDECLGDSSLTWQDTMAETFTFLPFGWSYLETVYKYRGGVSDDPKRNSKYQDGKIGWRKWSPRAQETLLRWEFDPDGGVKGLWQLAPPDFIIRYIPIEKALLFRTTSRKGNPEGRSILRNAFTSWYAKTNIQRIEAIGVERDLAGLPTVWVPPELLSSSATADEKAQLAAFKAMVVNIRRDEQEGVIMPLAYHPASDGSPTAQKMYDFTLTSSGGARQFDTDAIIARYDQRIATSILADFILLGQEQMGSFALSEDKTQLFLTALATWLDSVSAVVNRFAIPRLLRLNGRDLSNGSPELKHGKIERPDIAKLGPYVQALAAAGINVAGIADGKYLLDAASIPATDALSGPDQPDVQADSQEPGQQTGARGGGDEQREMQASESASSVPDGHWVTWEGRHLFIPAGGKGENNQRQVAMGPSGTRKEYQQHASTPAGKRGPDAAAALYRSVPITPSEVQKGDHVTFEQNGHRASGEVTATRERDVDVTITEGSDSRDGRPPSYAAPQRYSVNRSWITEARRAEHAPVDADAPAFTPKPTAAQVKDASIRYTRHGDVEMNGYLRRGADPLHPDEDDKPLAAEIQAVDQYIAKSKPLATETYVYRGISQAAVAALGIDRSAKEAIGVVFGDRAFVSTSADEQEARAFAEHALLRIRLPAGTRVGNLSSISKFPAEQERLLPRGSAFRITAVNMTSKPAIVHCMLEPKQELPKVTAKRAKKGEVAMTESEDRRSRYVWQADDLVLIGKGGD